MIRKMKHNVESMDEQMKKLSENMENISGSCEYIEGQFSSNRVLFLSRLCYIYYFLNFLPPQPPPSALLAAISLFSIVAVCVRSSSIVV